MNRLLMISNLPGLDPEGLSTASGKYELSLARGLSALGVRVTVLSFQAKRYESEGGIELRPCETANRLTDFSDPARQIEKLLDADGQTPTVILFFGYNPRLIDALLPFKGRAKLAAVVYDTHRGTLPGKSLARKAAIEAFYRRGLRKLRRLDGLVLFRQEAAERLKLKIPYCVILPTADPAAIRPWAPTGNERLRFLYAGTLCKYNASLELAEAFLRLPRETAELAIFGDGPLADRIRRLADWTQNVSYGGRVPAAVLDAEVQKADVLVNLRDMGSEVNRFAFPSKLVESMACGKPVLSTRVTDHPAFADAVFLAEDTRPETVAERVQYICDHREELPVKAAGAREYLLAAHNAETIHQKLAEFLFGGGMG